MSRSKHAHGSATRDGPGTRLRGQTADANRIARRFKQCFYVAQMRSEGVVLNIALRKLGRAIHPRRAQVAGHGNVQRDLSFHATSVDFQNRVGDGRIERAVGMHVDWTSRRERNPAARVEVHLIASRKPRIDAGKALFQFGACDQVSRWQRPAHSRSAGPYLAAAPSYH